MFRKVKILEEENGSALVLFALLFVIIIGFAGLAVDGGILYNTRSHLKKVANASVLSGAQELLNSDESVRSVVNNILDSHEEKNSLKSIHIKPDNQNMLRIKLEKDVPLYFLRLFKINSMKITASSAAGLHPMNRATGAVPLGINENIPLEYLKEYSLKVDSGDSSVGNFGILALSGPGARLYEKDLRSGFPGELKVGDIVDTQTGNVEGKTKEAINSRLNGCPYLVDDFSQRECSRIMLILVYEPYGFESGQLKQVKIKGYAYFYVKTPMSSSDSSIKGYFIKRAGSGYGNENTADKGAYAIRLVE
jgi:hypothetical protein